MGIKKLQSIEIKTMRKVADKNTLRNQLSDEDPL